MWTEERITLFRELWDSGISYGAIGHQLGITRSAVSGKAQRLGLKRELRGGTRYGLTREQKAARQRTRRAFQPAAPVKVEIIPDLPFLNLTYDELHPFQDTEKNQCRYIPGDDYRYCGQETLPGESWCASCKRIVYQPRGVAPRQYWRGVF